MAKIQGSRIHMSIKSVCIFCGSNTGGNPIYAETTRALVRSLAAAGIKIIFGGGKVGLMGVVAEAAIAAKAYVVGITPRRLLEHEVVHKGLSELHVVESMHERKVMMTQLSDAFIVLPGGMGTLDETFEVLTLTQLGVHRKACGLLNVAGFYDRLVGFLDHAVAERFIRAEHRGMVVVESDPQRLLAGLQNWTMPEVSKWMDQKV
jgi:uncharacterized protein (TIGR00730 family)